MKLVIIGDSIVKGTYTAPQDGCPSSVAKPNFAELLADALRCDLVNHGVNGVSYSSLSSVRENFRFPNNAKNLKRAT